MTAAPKPDEPRGRRAYRSPRRQQQAAETRDAVLAAAARLFAERGWAGTAMRDVAAEAGVAVETVYAGFRSKADLLTAAIDTAVVGDTLEVPLAERPEFLALAEGDLPTRARAAARLNTGINGRIAGVHRALTQAAGGDAPLAERLRADEDRRRTSVRQGAELVVRRPLTERELDGLWAVVGVEVYLLLTEIRGWSTAEYEAWLADTLLRLLSDPPETADHHQKGRA